MNEKVFIPGETVDVYVHPELKEGYIGKGKLIEHVSTSLPIIITPSKVSEELNLHYVIEYWRMQIGNEEYIKGIRRVWGIGKLTSSISTKEQMDTSEAEIREDFVILKDYDTSFWNSRVTGSELRRGSLY